MMMMMKMNCFCEWLIDQKRLSLFPAGIIVKDSYHIKSSKCREQLLNVHKTHFRLCRIKLRSNDTHFTKAHVIIIANHISDKLISTKLFRLNEMLRLQIVGNKARVNLRTGVSRKQSTPNFPKNEHFLPPDTHTFVCVSGGKKCSFFGEFGTLCFLETPVLRFTLLPYYQRSS